MRSRANVWWWYSAALLLVAAGAAFALLHGGDETEVTGYGDVPEVALAPPTTAAFGAAQGQSVVSPAGSTSGAPVRPQATPTPLPLPLDAAAHPMVRGAEITLDLAKGGFRAAFDRVAAASTAHGGFVAAATSRSDGSGQLVLRVPVARFDAARESIASLGDVQNQTIRGDDVGVQLVDQDARLRSLQAQEEALRLLVAKATSVNEVLQVQPTLFNVRQQIEQLQGQRAALEQAANLATISVLLYEPGTRSAVEPPTDNELAHRLRQAADGALAVIGGMIVVLGWLAPVAALTAAVAFVALRLRRRRLAAQ